MLLSQMCKMFGSMDNNITFRFCHEAQRLEVLRVLHASDNVTRAMHNLAHYMTIVFRSNDTVLLREKTVNNTAIAPS